MKQKGTFITMQIHKSQEIKDEYALKFFGVRLAKFLPNGWVHKNSLTPEKSLLFKVKQLEKDGLWNKDSFQNFYKPNYLKSLKNNKQAKQEYQEIISHLENGNDVYYACYCRNETICHRSIVADLIHKKGYDIIKK